MQFPALGAGTTASYKSLWDTFLTDFPMLTKALGGR